MRGSIFEGGARDPRPVPVEASSWEELLGVFGAHRVIPGGYKLSVPAISPAEYPEGATRSKGSVRRVHFAMLDYDHVTVAQRDAVLDAAAPWRCMLYTTWSHAERNKSEGSWSFRLVVALSRPVERGEWERFWPRLDAALGGLSDPKCRDESRIYFLPSAPSPEGCVLMSQEGAPFDVDAALASPLAAGAREESQRVGAQDLEELSDRLRRRQSQAGKAVGKALADALAGKPYAVEGSRDDTLFRIACAVATEWPRADAALVADALQASFDAAMAASSSGDAPGREDFVAKLERAKASAEADEEERRRRDADELAARISHAFGGERTEPYTEDELDRFAREAGVSRQAFRRMWIVQCGRAFYFFKDGQYTPPCPWETMQLAAETELAPAATADVGTWKTMQDGGVRMKTIQELTSEYGTFAERVVADLSARKSSFDRATRTMREAPCPIKEGFSPERSEDAEKWLELFAGKELPRVLDWLAGVTFLEVPCAGVYLDGPKGSGKSMFAQAVSRLWTDYGPTPLADIVGSFNDRLLRCPIVFGDEILPTALKEQGTGSLRELVQARNMTLRRKYLPTADMVGSIRLILAANNRNLLDTREAHTREDIDAISERFMYVEIAKAASEFVKSIGKARRDAMVEGGGLARHALWLRDTREIDTENRFLVAGDESALQRALVTEHGLQAVVCSWCCDYLLQPSRVDACKDLLARTHKGRLLVNARALVAHWDMYKTNSDAPTIGKAGRALRALSDTSKQLPAADGRPTNYWSIKVANLLQWASANQFCEETELLKALNRDTDLTGLPAAVETDPEEPNF
jgi:hypothetical protein